MMSKQETPEDEEEEIELVFTEKQVSDFVTVKIDQDGDVYIENKFLEDELMVLPSDEALGVARFIIEQLDGKA